MDSKRSALGRRSVNRSMERKSLTGFMESIRCQAYLLCLDPSAVTSHLLPAKPTPYGDGPSGVGQQALPVQVFGGSVKMYRRFFGVLPPVKESIQSAADFEKGLDAYEAGDHAGALRAWKPLAEQGHAEARLWLAGMYYQGAGVERDCAEAAKWYRLAAEQGDAETQHALGALYCSGEGVAEDAMEATRWLRRAAEQDLIESREWLGYLYSEGAGVEQDDQEAVKWFRLAAGQGSELARHYMENVYADFE